MSYMDCPKQDHSETTLTHFWDNFWTTLGQFLDNFQTILKQLGDYFGGKFVTILTQLYVNFGKKVSDHMGTTFSDH